MVVGMKACASSSSQRPNPVVLVASIPALLVGMSLPEILGPASFGLPAFAGPVSLALAALAALAILLICARGLLLAPPSQPRSRAAQLSELVATTVSFFPHLNGEGCKPNLSLAERAAQERLFNSDGSFRLDSASGTSFPALSPLAFSSLFADVEPTTPTSV